MKQVLSETKSKYTSEQRTKIEELLKEYHATGKKESKELSDFLKEYNTSIKGLSSYLARSAPGKVNPMKGKSLGKKKGKVTKSAKQGRPKLKKEEIIEFLFHIPTGQLYRANEFRQTAFIL